MNMFRQFAGILKNSEVNIPQTTVTDTNNPIQAGLQILFAILSAVALLIIVISALKMILARGNADDFGRARSAIIYALIGLVICMAAFVIVTFVLENV